VPLVTLVVAALAFGRWAWRTSQNLAADAHVTLSSTNMHARDASKLVRGEWTSYYAVITGYEPGAWIALELDKSRHIGTVVVYNRGDGSLEDSLPLALEVETDSGWVEVARRTEVFGLAAPWIINDVDRTARRIRLKRDHRGTLALARVEIYADNHFKP
jgi:hypothetical protein